MADQAFWSNQEQNTSSVVKTQLLTHEFTITGGNIAKYKVWDAYFGMAQ